MRRVTGSIPSASLNDRLAHCAVTPLAPDIRHDMEARFRTSFADVRVHTGPAAAALCAAARAQALTVGSDVVFAAGAYAPASPHGRRLLAHELVHVLQQRAARDTPQPAPRGRTDSPPAQPGLVAIGDAHDACEREADTLASEALAGGLRSRVTPDASGAIRRRLGVSPDSVDMVTSYDGAVPGISYVMRGNTPFAVLHLSRNSGPIIRDDIRSRAQVSAMRITSTALVDVDPKDRADDVNDKWSFRFVQLFQLVAKQGAYAGPTASDGHMRLNFAGPVNYRGYQKFLIDSDPDDTNQIPYADHARTFEKFTVPGLWRAKVVLDDHPFTDVPLRLPNFAAGNKRNYLYQLFYQFEIVTTLVAIDRINGGVQPLMHLTWRASLNASLPWRITGTDTPEVGPPQFMSSRLSVGGAVKGAPTGRGLAAMIQNSGTAEPQDTYIRAVSDAYSAVLMSTRNNGDVEAAATWPTNVVPSGHFRR